MNEHPSPTQDTTPEGQVALPPTAAEMGHKPTVRGQLAVALEALLGKVDLDLKGNCRWCGRRPMGLPCQGRDCDGFKARLALDRHRAEPEGGFGRREALLVALDDLFECDYRSISSEEWSIAREAFKAAISELQCPDGCDTSCRCYQEGLEAQRERVGGGRA